MIEVYDQQGHLLTDYDLSNGYLVNETRTIHHEAVEGAEEQGHYETLQEYPNGGKDVKWVVDVPGATARDAWDEEKTVGIYIPYTPEELAEKASEAQRGKVMAEAQAALVTAQINTIIVDDATAFRWRLLYPEWAPDGLTCKAGEKYQRQNKLWRCRQEHTSQAGWAPELAPSLWEEINETHAGTVDDPIPYSGNMALEEGKYYSQDGATYRCTRDTEIPVYSPLAELVGLYVEVVGITGGDDKEVR